MIDNGDNRAAWSSKYLVDKLCPSFTESGAIVACEPVEGYPLTVMAKEGAATISRCGKNLIDYTEAYPRTKSDGTVIGTISFIDGGISWDSGNYFFVIPCTVRAGGTVTFSCKGMTTNISYVVLYNRGTAKACSGQEYCGDPMVATADADAIYVYKTNPADQIETPIVLTELQLEYGSVVTSYEPYKAVETFSPGADIPALNGVNIIWADSGIVTVKGKANPGVILERLSKNLAALGANV